jgi:hypothetical protein
VPDRYTDRIKEYCEKAGIGIPAGFYRHPANRFAIIDVGNTPPKLIAKTWFKKEDVVYYIKNLSQSAKLRILDFKEREELRCESDEKLVRQNEF